MIVGHNEANYFENNFVTRIALRRGGFDTAPAVGAGVRRCAATQPPMYFMLTKPGTTEFIIPLCNKIKADLIPLWRVRRGDPRPVTSQHKNWLPAQQWLSPERVFRFFSFCEIV